MHLDSHTILNPRLLDAGVQVLSNPYPAHQGVQWINPAAFVPNALGTFGNVGRDALRGPGNVSFDVAVSRRFKLGERLSLVARVESFNAINHTNFVGAISPAGGASYTTLPNKLNTSTFGQVQSAFDPRIMQLVMKLYF